MKPKIFISLGSASNQLQATGTEIIRKALEVSGLSPRQMGRDEWSSEQPLRAIKRVIAECEGAVVIAFCRYHFPSGMERGKSAQDNQLEDVRLPTVWNHIEAAMAYMNNLPILIIAEEGLREEGLIEGKYDWTVFWTDYSSESLSSEKFYGFIASFKRLVLEGKEQRPREEPLEPDITKLSIGKIFKNMNLPQLWAFLGILAGLLVAAFLLGKGELP